MWYRYVSVWAFDTAGLAPARWQPCRLLLPAHGSSMTESLSWIRCLHSQRSVNLFLQQRRNHLGLLSSLPPQRCSVIHELPHLLLAALPSQPSPSRQHILWLSQRRWLLEGSHPVSHAVDTCSGSAESALTGLLRSISPALLSVRSYRTPGFVRCVPRS